jgi:hypothetical protein
MGEIIFYPSGAIPSELDRVWDDPPTYAKLAPVRSETLRPGDYMLTQQGLTKVVAVEDAP